MKTIAQLQEEDFYTRLGIRSDATRREIDAAYEEMSLQYDPDKASGSTIAQFQCIIEAKERSQITIPNM